MSERNNYVFVCLAMIQCLATDEKKKYRHQVNLGLP